MAPPLARVGGSRRQLVQPVPATNRRPPRVTQPPLAEGCLPESQGQNLALNALCVPHSLDSGIVSNPWATSVGSLGLRVWEGRLNGWLLLSLSLSLSLALSAVNPVPRSLADTTSGHEPQRSLAATAVSLDGLGETKRDHGETTRDHRGETTRDHQVRT